MEKFDGMTFEGQLLEDIKILLMLQLITSGIGGEEIAKVLGQDKKNFKIEFPWATWGGR